MSGAPYPTEACNKVPEGRRHEVNIKNITVNRNFGLAQVSDLFSSGMGVDAPVYTQPGRSTPKIKDSSKSPQKNFNRERDQAMQQGVLKLAYPKEELGHTNKINEKAHVQLKGLKLVEVNQMPAFALNK